jgi:hypothetical protein
LGHCAGGLRSLAALIQIAKDFRPPFQHASIDPAVNKASICSVVGPETAPACSPNEILHEAENLLRRES